MCYYTSASLGLIMVAVFLGDSCQAEENVGPYNIEVSDINDCRTNGERNINVRASRYSGEVEGEKTQLFSIESYFPFNKEEFEALELSIAVLSRDEDGFPTIYEYTDNLCQFVTSSMKDAYNVLREKMGLEKDDCAIKPGNYSFNNWTPVPYLPRPEIKYGNYAVYVELLLEKKVIMCLQPWFTLLVPKP